MLRARRCLTIVRNLFTSTVETGVGWLTAVAAATAAAPAPVAAFQATGQIGHRYPVQSLARPFHSPFAFDCLQKPLFSLRSLEVSLVQAPVQNAVLTSWDVTLPGSVRCRADKVGFGKRGKDEVSTSMTVQKSLNLYSNWKGYSTLSQPLDGQRPRCRRSDSMLCKACVHRCASGTAFTEAVPPRSSCVPQSVPACMGKSLSSVWLLGCRWQTTSLLCSRHRLRPRRGWMITPHYPQRARHRMQVPLHYSFESKARGGQGKVQVAV